MQNITELCTTNTLSRKYSSKYNRAQSKIIHDTLQNYNTPELHPKQIKYHSNTLIRQLLQPNRSPPAITHHNRYSCLDKQIDTIFDQMEDDPPAPPMLDNHRQWVTDAKIASLADTVRNKLIINRQKAAEDAGEEPPPYRHI